MIDVVALVEAATNQMKIPLWLLMPFSSRSWRITPLVAVVAVAMPPPLALAPNIACGGIVLGPLCPILEDVGSMFCSIWIMEVRG